MSSNLLTRVTKEDFDSVLAGNWKAAASWLLGIAENERLQSLNDDLICSLALCSERLVKLLSLCSLSKQTNASVSSSVFHWAS